jgi:hypothetical protein
MGHARSGHARSGHARLASIPRTRACTSQARCVPTGAVDLLLEDGACPTPPPPLLLPLFFLSLFYSVDSPLRPTRPCGRRRLTSRRQRRACTSPTCAARKVRGERGHLLHGVVEVMSSSWLPLPGRLRCCFLGAGAAEESEAMASELATALADFPDSNACKVGPHGGTGDIEPTPSPASEKERESIVLRATVRLTLAF